MAPHDAAVAMTNIQSLLAREVVVELNSNIPMFHLHGSTPGHQVVGSMGMLTLFPVDSQSVAAISTVQEPPIFESPPGACHESSSITMFGGIQWPCLAHALARPGGPEQEERFPKGHHVRLALSAAAA